MISVLDELFARQDALAKRHIDTLDLGEALLSVVRFHVLMRHKQVDVIVRLVALLICQHAFKLSNGIFFLLHGPLEVRLIEHLDFFLFHHDTFLSVTNKEDLLEHVNESIVGDGLADSA